MMALPETPASPVLLEAARAYADFGWHVFPCRPNKAPRTPNGCLDATTDAMTIEGWWEQEPQATIGIACGPSRIVVVDYDPKHDPDLDGICWLDDQMKGVETRSARTGSGGKHIYFRAPNDIEIRNSAGALGPGIDIRGAGGYVIAPPSSNEQGPYEWLNKSPLAPFPPSLIEELHAPAKTTAPTSEGGIIPEGRRNEILHSLAGTFRKRGMSPLAIEKALIVENQEHCRPPLSEREVLAIARSSTRYAPDASVLTQAPAPTGAPIAEIMAEDTVHVSVSLATGARALFAFTEMEKERRELNAHLAIHFFEAGDEPYQQRINLESSSARTDLRRELDNLYGKDYGWPKALNGVWTLARKTFLGQDRGVALPDIPRLVGMRDLVSPLMPSEGATVLFGDGSTSKSYLALALAIAGVTDQMVAGYVVPQAPVLYIDYEDSDTNFRRRAGRILDGIGHSHSLPSELVYWRARGIPLRDQWDSIKRSCERNGVGWIIVDSAAPACGGPPEEAVSALGFFSSLERIGLPSLVIAHITKTGENSTHKPLGSAFWHNCARRTWYIKRLQEEESDEMDLGLYCRKVNDGPKPRPQGLRVSFDGDEGSVTFGRQDLNAVPDLVSETSTKNRVWSVLTQPMTVAQIAEATDLGEPAIKNVLRRSPDSFVAFGSSTPQGGRPANLWARKSRDEGAPF